MINIKHIAKLANINLTKKDEKIFEIQLKNIVTLISQLEEVDTKDVDHDLFQSDAQNRTGNDDTAPSLSVKSALSNSDNTYNDHFMVELLLKNRTI